MNRTGKKLSPVQIKRRIWACWGVLVLMAAYMVLIGELGLGDSRIMTPLATLSSRVIFFGGMGWVISRIVWYKRLLREPDRQEERRRDERDQYLYEKSGGIVLDLLLLVLLLVTCTAALWDMRAFYVSLILLACALILKFGSWLFYQHKY